MFPWDSRCLSHPMTTTRTKIAARATNYIMTNKKGRKMIFVARRRHTRRNFIQVPICTFNQSRAETTKFVQSLASDVSLNFHAGTFRNDTEIDLITQEVFLITIELMAVALWKEIHRKRRACGPRGEMNYLFLPGEIQFARRRHRIDLRAKRNVVTAWGKGGGNWICIELIR